MSTNERTTQTAIKLSDDLLSSVATAIDGEIMSQYERGEDWEEAKDVLECLDYCEIARVAIAALNKWQERI
jgi:hypothetical protein